MTLVDVPDATTAHWEPRFARGDPDGEGGTMIHFLIEDPAAASPGRADSPPPAQESQSSQEPQHSPAEPPVSVQPLANHRRSDLAKSVAPAAVEVRVPVIEPDRTPTPAGLQAVAPVVRPVTGGPPVRAAAAVPVTIRPLSAPLALPPPTAPRPAGSTGTAAGRSLAHVGPGGGGTRGPVQADRPARRRRGVDAGDIGFDLPAPVYPRLSRRLGESGEVELEFEVLADGRVGAVRVLRDPGFPRLVRAALGAVRSASRQRPAGDEPRTVRKTFRFVLR